MINRPHGAPDIRKPTLADIPICLRAGLRDFRANPFIGLFFASFYVVTGLLMGWITYVTGQTFWLVLAVMGFPLVGTLAAVGFYEISRRRLEGEEIKFSPIASHVWSFRGEQLSWFAAIIIVIFLFWFFLGHMIFALFLGLSPMINVSSSIDVFYTVQGFKMIGFGSVIGAAFALLVFSLSVLGMPMLIDRDVDFMTAMIQSIAAVRDAPLIYLLWGASVAVITLVSMLPYFLGLFITMPILGHASWHLYKQITGTSAP